MRKPQKALHLYLDEEKAKPKHVGRGYMIFEKWDGWFMYIDCINGEWQAISSKACRELPSMQYYTDLFKEFVPAPKVDCRLIFEATLHEQDGMPMIFSKLNGLFNQQHTAIREGVKVKSKTFGEVYLYTGVKLMCHDLIIFGKEDKEFHRRYDDLKTLMRVFFNKEPTIVLTIQCAPLLGCSSSKALWMQHYHFICSKYNGQGEGVVLKDMNAPYSYNKRNADLLKIKCENSFELRVTALEEGEGKYKGTLGKLVVTDACGNSNSVSGMTDTQRALWWETPELILLAIVEVACMKVLPNKSLREGRFKAIRYDKSRPDEL